MQVDDYDFARRRHVDAFRERIDGEVQKVTWPLGRLCALRDERLRSLVRFAKENSQWHARRLRDIDPDNLSGDEMSSIPTMTKADLMRNWDQIVTDTRLTLDTVNQHLTKIARLGPAYLLDEYHAVASGGTSGLRGVFVWDFEGWLTYALNVQRTSYWLDRRRSKVSVEESRRAWITASNPTHMTAAVSRTFSHPGAISKSFPVALPFREIVNGLNEFQPTHISSYPSMLHRLSFEVRTGRLRIAPVELTTGSEPLLPEAKSAIEDAFSLPVVNTYSTSETAVIARSFPGSPGMHLYEDAVVLEPVDANNERVLDGVTSTKVLITNIINKALPLIRYELTDEVVFLKDPNPDLWTGRRIGDVQGRSDHVFLYDDRTVVHPHVFRAVLGHFASISEYQVRQTVSGAEIALRVVGKIDVERVASEVRDSLVRLGLDPAVSVVLVDEFERPSTASKVPRFIPLQR